MKQYARYLTIILTAIVMATAAIAQGNDPTTTYTVKKKDTLFGIAKQQGITIPELMDANPDMKREGYELRKGDVIRIPGRKNTIVKSTDPNDIRNREIRVGIMLPLHDIDGDGKRMVEYYRGVLMACDSLKNKGISTKINAWNVAIDDDIQKTLFDEQAAQCDIIFGPLYTRQVKALSNFCKAKKIKMVIPFSINGDEVMRNEYIYQVYQSPEKVNNDAVTLFLKRFQNSHAVFVGCNDSTSRKGSFTAPLRAKLSENNIKYNITNIASTDEQFANAFSTTKNNVVILNTGRMPELRTAVKKLRLLKSKHPEISITLFGYTEWLMYARHMIDDFFDFDTYLPSTFYYNPRNPKTISLENSYRHWFGTDMQQAMPRFAITGYDQAQFFLQGMHEYGAEFSGETTISHYKPLQTQLIFKRVANGGWQNSNVMLIHYSRDKKIETIRY